MSDDFSIVHYSGLETESFTESNVEHWKLTAALGATEMRANAVELDPGESLDVHAHERQEEMYVAVTDGQVEIEGGVYDVPEGGVAGVLMLFGIVAFLFGEFLIAGLCFLLVSMTLHIRGTRT